MATSSSAYLVKGDDQTVTAGAVRDLVAELVGDTDAALVVEELDGEDYPLASVMEAVQTPAFLVDRRVVVARGIGRFTTAEVAPLLGYIADPLPGTSLVLVAGGGQTPRPLAEAVRKNGTVVDAGIGRGKGRSEWLAARLREAPVRLDSRAAAAVGAHLGDDLGRLGSLLDVLASAFGPGATLGPDDVAPYLGRPGAVAPWDLADAIDATNTAKALELLGRMLGAGASHPLQINAILHSHYTRMLRLDGDPAVNSERTAADALGLTGSTFPARKSLAGARRLGHRNIIRAIELLAAADLDLKGAIDWPPEMVMEVLVARLSRLGARR